MPVAIDIQLPGVRAEQYAEMFAQMAPLLAAAPGFLTHAATPEDGGVRIVELWRSEDDWKRFVELHVAPAAQALGVRPVTQVRSLQRLLTVPHVGPPRDRAATAAATVAPLAVDEGPSFQLGPLTIVVKEDGRNTRQTLAVAEFRGKSFRIPPHTHTQHDESIYVLEGTLGVRLGDGSFTAPAGTSFTIPVDVPHSVWNDTEVPVRFLNTIVPARYLDYFHEMAAVATGGKLAPPEEMKRVMGRYGLRPLA